MKMLHTFNGEKIHTKKMLMGFHDQPLQRGNTVDDISRLSNRIPAAQ